MISVQRWIVLFRCAVLALVVLLTSAPSDAAVGRTPGSFTVTDSGAASYSIPIFTPPGPRGVQPSVSLVYNSSTRRGYLGRGWSLAGFSSIRRCPRTKAQDGESRPVLLVYYIDGYCLDGNRLRMQSGSYGQDGSVYYTQMADFSRTTAHGTAGSGPAYWTVERKDGLTYTYGGSTDSRVLATGTSTASQWMVSEISDRAGNKVRFTWEAADATTTGMTHPVRIEWTQTSAGSGNYLYSMEFNYSQGGNSAATTPAGYLKSKEYKDTDLLTSISIKVSSTVEKHYVLTYEASPTGGAQRLTEITECSDAVPSDCLSPTEITYQDGSAGVDTSNTALYLPGNITDANGEYDFNGDGIKDMAYLSSGTWRVMMGSASGYGTAVDTGLSALRAGKIRGTRADQLVGKVGSVLYVYTWNGTGFSGASTYISWSGALDDIVVADVNADGRSDIVYYNQAQVSQDATLVYWPLVEVRAHLSSSNISGLSFSSTQSTWDYVNDVPDFIDLWTMMQITPYWAGEDVTYRLTKGGDVNGDGIEDINVEMYYDLCAWDYFPGGNKYGCEEIGFSRVLLPGQWSTRIADASQNIYTATVAEDFNQDGCKDFAGTTNVILAGCADSGTAALSLANSYAGAADITGDGIKDIIVDAGSTFHAIPVLANSLGSAVDTGIAAPTGCRFIVTDANGDGLDDMGCLIPGTSLTIYFHYGTTSNGLAPYPDLVSQFQDGYGVTYSPAYTTYATSSYEPYSNATYPNSDYSGSGVLVASVTQSDGIGGTFQTEYKYYGAVRNVQGLGFQGFDKIDATDKRGGDVSNPYHSNPYNYTVYTRSFNRNWPYSGALKSESWKKTYDGFAYLTRTYNLASVTLDSASNNDRQFTYTSQVNETNSLDGTTTTTQYTYDSVDDDYGNLTTVSQASSDGYSTWTTTTAYDYSPNTYYWCIGLPTSATVTHQAPGTSNIVQLTNFSPEYAACNLESEVYAPSSSTLKVKTDYEYDAFGNVSSVSVTGQKPDGNPMTTRVSLTGWGTTGQFPVSSTNALSHPSTIRIFDSTFGVLLSETDPNGIVVVDNNTPDDFGRITRSDRPDGTYTIFEYESCATYGCQNGDPSSGATSINKAITIASEFDANNSQIRDAWTYTDQFDRPVVQTSQTLSGAYSRTGIQYDDQGRVGRQTAPCMVGSCTVYWTTNVYDAYGREAEQKRPRSDGNPSTVSTYATYSGLYRTSVDAEGNSSTKLMSPLGQMVQSWDEYGYGQYFSYDALGNLSAVSDSLSNSLFTANYYYGVQALKYSDWNVNLGSRSYSHNSLGELVGGSDANGNSFTLAYDALSRLTSRTEDEGTTTFTWGTSSANYNIGQLASVAMANYAEALSYDAFGRPSTRSITADGNVYNIDYSYNSQGLLDVLTFPTSTSSTRLKLKYGYQYGALKSVTDWTIGSAGAVYWTANTKNGRGQTTQETLGNGVVTTRGFDAVTGWLGSIQSVHGSTSLQNLSYAFDKVGNVTQRQENYLGLTENFYYDDLYRLTSSQVNSNTPVTYDYGANGNIESRSDVNGGQTWSYSGYAVTGTGSGGPTYGYDANGNMTHRDSVSQNIYWTSYNYPEQISSGSEASYFYYGPDRQYYRQDYTAPGVAETTYYIAGLLEKVSNGSVTEWRHYVRADGQIVAIVSRDSNSVNSVDYALEDSQASSSSYVDSGGNLLVRANFSPFGAPRDGTDWDGGVPSGDQATINGVSRRGYTGHSMLGAMGLIHMNGRVQDAITGRFLSPDPTVPFPGLTQSYNRYAYVRNNPMSFIDPSGFAETDLELDQVLVNGKRLPKPPPLIRMMHAPCNSGHLENCSLLERYSMQQAADCDSFSVFGGGCMPRPFDYGPRIGGTAGSTGLTIADSNWVRPESQSCMTAKQCGTESFWRDNAVGRFLSHIADPLAVFNDGLNPLSKNWLTTGELNDARLAGFLSVVGPGTLGYKSGIELTFGRNFRLAPFGNRTGHELGELPHYHRRGIDSLTGETIPGQGIGRHRPWEIKSTDDSFLDRF